MPVVFDATTLLPVLWPEVPVPRGTSGKPIEGFIERVDFLVERLSKSRTKILIPAPAWAEVLVQAGNAKSAYMDRINASNAFRIVPFDAKAAVEVAYMAFDSKAKQAKRHARSDETIAKVKYDRQIVATAKTQNATAIYSNDGGVATLGARLGIQVIGVESLPLPPKNAQAIMTFDDEKAARPTEEKRE